MNKHTANFQVLQPKTCGIYQIVLVEDKRCYVGSSKDVRERWYHHRGQLDQNRHHSPYLQNAWNKYGPNAFRFELLEECDADLLLEREQLWMDKLDSVFNLVKSAMRGGHAQTPETIEKIRATSTGRLHAQQAKDKVSAAQLGRPKSQEHRDKLSAAQFALRGDSCHRGHRFDEENTTWRLNPNGRKTRLCKTCSREKASEYRQKEKRNHD